MVTAQDVRKARLAALGTKPFFFEELERKQDIELLKEGKALFNLHDQSDDFEIIMIAYYEALGFKVIRMSPKLVEVRVALTA